MPKRIDGGAHSSEGDAPKEGPLTPKDQSLGGKPISAEPLSAAGAAPSGGRARSAEESYLRTVEKTKGFIAYESGRLTITSDPLQSKRTFSQAKAYLDSLEGRVSKVVLDRLYLKLAEGVMVGASYRLPSSDRNGILTKLAEGKGLMAAVYHMEAQHELMASEKKRYSPVADWDEATRGEHYLHVLPSVAPPVDKPMPLARIEDRPSVVLNMMEPSLERSVHIGAAEYSNAELLILSTRDVETMIHDLPSAEQSRIRKHKEGLDNYYRNKIAFTYESGGRKYLVTIPTTRYTNKQFIVLSTPGREDILAKAEEARKRRAINFVEQSKGGAHVIDAFQSESLSPSAAREIVREVEARVNPSSVTENNQDIEAIHDLVAELPDESFVAQNSFDASTDARYEHLQCFFDAPCESIPGFNAKEEVQYQTSYRDEKGKEESVRFSRLRHESFHGSIYRVSCSGHGPQTKALLKKMQDRFMATENNGSSLNLVGRKKADGSFEYYFILRKSISSHPSLQRHAVELGTTRPGFAEMMGIRLAKNPDFFEAIPDKPYRDLLQSFAVEEKECHTFERIAKEELRAQGPIESNLLETNLRALRSDAETSQMYHCVLLNGSRSELDAVSLMTNAPDAMVPNLLTCAANAKRKSFERVAGEMAGGILQRIAAGKNFGLVAVDEHALKVLPEYQELTADIKAFKEEYVRGGQRQNFKEFLLEKYRSNPSMLSFLSFFSDHNLALLLEHPDRDGELHIHQALMQRALGIVKDLKKDPARLQALGLSKEEIEEVGRAADPNVRFTEYEYGITNLRDETPGVVNFSRRAREALLYGGTKFNTFKRREVAAAGRDVFTGVSLIPAFQELQSGASKRRREQIIQRIAGRLFDEYTPKTSIEVKEIRKKIAQWSKEWVKSGQIETKISSSLAQQIEEKLNIEVAKQMMPIFASKGESYALEDLSLLPSEIPEEFLDGDRVAPCSFRTFRSPKDTACSDVKRDPMAMMPVGRKIAIVMNGGQASGVADVAAGALIAAGPQNDVDIFVHGNEGLVRGDATPVKLEDLALIQSQGGFPGGTTRFALRSAEDVAKAQENLQKYDGVVFIGGDGSYRHNKQMFVDAGVPVYFCIKTIDGDFKVEDTDLTLGFYTAVAGYGEMIEERKAKAARDNEMHFVQVGGRFAGYLAAGTSALLEGSERPNLSLFPEEIEREKWTLGDVVDICAKTCAIRIAREKSPPVVSVAEGVVQAFPEVQAIVSAIKEMKENGETFANGLELKAKLRDRLASLRDSPAGQMDYSVVLEAFSDADVMILAKPDAIGRIPVAKIDTHAFLGRLTHAKLAFGKRILLLLS